jgi:hypothetical protein
MYAQALRSALHARAAVTAASGCAPCMMMHIFYPFGRQVVLHCMPASALILHLPAAALHDLQHATTELRSTAHLPTADTSCALPPHAGSERTIRSTCRAYQAQRQLPHGSPTLPGMAGSTPLLLQ